MPHGKYVTINRVHPFERFLNARPGFRFHHLIGRGSETANQSRCDHSRACTGNPSPIERDLASCVPHLNAQMLPMDNKNLLANNLPQPPRASRLRQKRVKNNRWIIGFYSWS